MAQDPGTTNSAGSAGHSSASGSLQLLPIDKVFLIQIGSEVFRISYLPLGGYVDNRGNALNSDSPSYFTHYFSSNSVDELKTLYIDRDPVIFKDIVRHLQGYLLTPRNEEHFVYFPTRGSGGLMWVGTCIVMRSIIDYPNFDNVFFEIFTSGLERQVSKFQRNCSSMSNTKEIPRISFQWVFIIPSIHLS